MNISSLNIFKKTPIIEEKKPSKGQFLSLIESAQKADHQIYTEKKLTPFYFNVNANLPSILDIITAPYHIFTTVINIPKEKLKKISVSLEHAHFNLLIQTANFLSAIITPLLYLGSFCGIVIVETGVIVPILIGLGFITSCVEIFVNATHLYQQNKFLKAFNLKTLKSFSDTSTIFSKEKLMKSLSSLITSIKKEDIFNDKNYQKNLLESLDKINTDLKNNPEFTLPQAKRRLKVLLKKFKKELITAKMEALERKFFSITSKNKLKIQPLCEKYYDKLNYPSALHHSFSLIQDVFREKKIHLANRVQPQLALNLINNYKDILKNLKSKSSKNQSHGIRNGLILLKRANYNASIKKQVHITNIVLFGLAMSSYALPAILPLAPLIPIALFIAVTVIYYFNSFRINAILNSKSYTIDWKNCYPTWTITLVSKIHSLGCKIHSLFTPKESLPSIPNAVPLTL